MRLVQVSLSVAVALAAMLAFLIGQAAGAPPATSSAGTAGGHDGLGMGVTPSGHWLLAQVSSADEPSANNPDPVKEPWEQRVEQSEQSNLIKVLVFLSIVVAILLFWWGWGKVYHRPRKL